MVVVLAGLGCNSASRNGVRQVSGDLYVDPPNVDFGDVALGKEQVTQVTLRNDGIVRMTVDSLPGDLGAAFGASGLPIALNPGESTQVAIRYAPPALGSFAGRLRIVTDASGTDTDVDLRGHAVRGLAQVSGDLDFGDVVMNERQSQVISLNNNDGHAQTTVVVQRPDGSDSGAFAVAPAGPLQMGPEQSMQVRVDFTPDHLGDFSSTVLVTPCPTCQPRDLKLTGRGVTRLVQVTPEAINFGEALMGSDQSQPFSVTNTSRNKVQLTSLTHGGAGELTADLGNVKLPVVLDPGQTVTGLARFSPRTLGAQAASMTLAASDGAPGLLNLSGLAMGPVIQALPHSLYVGAVALGTTRQASVTVTNIGLDPSQKAPLSLNGITIVTADPGWALLSGGSASVGEPGSSVKVQLSYTPRAAVASDATLVLDSNDGLTPHLEIPLRALGRDLKPCTLEAIPGTTVDFGPTPLFHPTTQGFELTNTTADDCIVGEPSLSGGPAFHWPGGVIPGGRTLPSGGRMSVRVEFEPEAAQAFYGKVSFYVSNKDTPTYSVDLVGSGDSSCLFVTPGAVDFGAATQGCSAPDQVAWVVNQCASAVTVTGVSTSGAPFFLGPMPQGNTFTVQPQTSERIPLTYQAATPGDDIGQLYVQTSLRAAPYKVGLTAGSQDSQRVGDSWDQSTPKVDMLFVIDNSGSMAEEQHALAANLDHLWNRIALANADFHIAVTTTGMSAYTSGWTQCPGGAQGGEAGRFFPVDNSRPRIITPQTPNAKDALFANIGVGQCHWDERFFDPVIAALTAPLITSVKAPGTPLPNDGNAGFLRDDARLALMAVSDADDDADVTNPPPVSDYVAKLAAVKHGALDLISFAGIVALKQCATVEGIGNRYMEIASQLNGHLEDICDLANFGKLLDNSLGDLLLPLTSFPLSQHPRSAADILVTVDNIQVTNFTYDAAANRIVFPKTAVPAPGSHITASYQAGCN